MSGELFKDTLQRILAKDTTLPDQLSVYQQGMRQNHLNDLMDAIEEFPAYKERIKKINLDSDPYDTNDSDKNLFMSVYIDSYPNLVSLSIRCTRTKRLEIRDCPVIKKVHLVGNPDLHLLVGSNYLNGVTIMNSPKLLWGRGFINPAYPPTSSQPVNVPNANTTAKAAAEFKVLTVKTGTKKANLPRINEQSDATTEQEEDWFPKSLLWDNVHADSGKERTNTVTTADTTLATSSEPNTPASPLAPGYFRDRSNTAEARLGGDKARLILT